MTERYHSTGHRPGQTGQRQPSTGHSGDPFWDLVATAKTLQAPGGCKWDRAQTVDSLLPFLIEETWEVFEVIKNRRDDALGEELGDVLYTVLFLALVAERTRQCSLHDLLTATRNKMIRRHPHVFSDASAATPKAAYRQWQASKRLEKKTSPSPSKAFRKQLMAWWEWLYTHPQAHRKTPPDPMRNLLRKRQPLRRQANRQTNVRRVQPNAKLRQATIR